MTRTSYLGIAVGVLVLLFVPPVAVFVGALSAAFHRGVEPTTFGLAISWICRWMFYGVAALIAVGILVIGSIIDIQITMFVLIAAGLVALYLSDRRLSHGDGGRVL